MNKPLPESPPIVSPCVHDQAHPEPGEDRRPRLPDPRQVAIPHEDKALWWGLDRRLETWLRELGPRRCVRHAGGWCHQGQAMALYFRTSEDAEACLAAIPEFELADGVGSVTYYSPAVR